MIEAPISRQKASYRATKTIPNDAANQTKIMSSHLKNARTQHIASPGWKTFKYLSSPSSTIARERAIPFWPPKTRKVAPRM